MVSACYRCASTANYRARCDQSIDAAWIEEKVFERVRARYGDPDNAAHARTAALDTSQQVRALRAQFVRYDRLLVDNDRMHEHGDRPESI